MQKHAAQSPVRCRLGQWYSNENHRLTSSAEIVQLEEPHRLMHRVVDAEVSKIVERWMGGVLPDND